ncbi:hypothetical protein PENTCL1PPCAC_2638, partial [Pristionchus entomophagus]
IEKWIGVKWEGIIMDSIRLPSRSIGMGKTKNKKEHGKKPSKISREIERWIGNMCGFPISKLTCGHNSTTEEREGGNKMGKDARQTQCR